MKNSVIFVLVAIVISFAMGIVGQYKIHFLGESEVHGHDDDHAHETDAGHDHSQEAEAASAHGHAHGHGDGKCSQMTVYNDQVEIFLEHPFLVSAQPAEFVTHVSYVESGLPRKAGPVTFIMRQGQGDAIEHIEKAPARDGIYIPALSFPKHGQWKLAMVIPGKKGNHRIDLQDVTVYPNQQEADAVPEDEEIEGISFLKEQQWRWRSLTEIVKEQIVNGENSIVVPESCIVYDRDDIIIYVQLAGETVEKRVVTLGQVYGEMIQVASGLEVGERVIARGAYVISQKEQGKDDSHAHGSDSHSSVVQLTDHAIDKHQIVSGYAEEGTLNMQVILNGQIALNADKVAHIVPMVSGVVRHVDGKVGDIVKKGEVLAWLESTELGQAKADYLTSQANLDCLIELERAREIHKNTSLLLKLLESNPPIESLNNIIESKKMGENRSKLISAYAEYLLADSTFQREKGLYEKKVTSQNDFLKAESDLQKTTAIFTALRDSVKFEIRHNLIEAQQDQRLREIEFQNARCNLYVLGMTDKEIAHLDRTVHLHISKQDQETPGHAHDMDHSSDSEHFHDEAHAHNEEHAHDEGLGQEKLAWYPLRAPFDGTILTRGLTLGESIATGQDVFVLADLDTVWVDFQVHAKDASVIKPGQNVIVQDETGTRGYECTLSYISPVVDQMTRTCLARAILHNKLGQHRPGQFVQGNVSIENIKASVTVSKQAIQYVDDKPCVFVKTSQGYEMRAITLGRSTDELVEILTGLGSNEEVVIKNAFRIKSEVEKSTDDFGGHGHPH